MQIASFQVLPMFFNAHENNQKSLANTKLINFFPLKNRNGSVIVALMVVLEATEVVLKPAMVTSHTELGD